jgi:transcriptional regulator with XRE-family HTH domain
MTRSTIKVRTDILEAWLRVSGLTKAKLARQLGVSKSRVTQIFNGDAEPSARLLAQLLLATELPFDRLFSIERQQKGGSRMIVTEQTNGENEPQADSAPEVVS